MPPNQSKSPGRSVLDGFSKRVATNRLRAAHGHVAVLLLLDARCQPKTPETCFPCFTASLTEPL